MTSRETIKIALISDLHTFDSTQDICKVANTPPSRLDISKEHLGNPVTSLIKYINSEGLSADYLLCAGDITDKAAPTSFQKGWEYVHNIKEALGSKLFATCGNHDFDSRGVYNHYDPKGMMQNVNPSFPQPDNLICNEFWSKNYHIYRNDKINIITLNTAAYHGYDKEEEHGRISEYTLKSIKNDLGKVQDLNKMVNIILCHHHPFRNHKIEKDNYSEMKGGSELLDVLGSGKFGDWLIIHGHIHYPNIMQAYGDASSPIIFSLGSLSATPYSTSENGPYRNQFYIIEINTTDVELFGIRGTGNAWNFSEGNEWSKAIDMRQRGIPYNFGFGNNEKPKTIANKIFQKLKNGNDWNSIQNDFKEIKFLFPSEYRTLISFLKSYELELIYNDQGKIKEVVYGV